MTYTNLILVLATAGCMMACTEKKPLEDKWVNDETIAVKTFSLQPTEGRLTLTRTGLLGTTHEANYAFKMGGVIDRVYVREGAFFKKGTLLAALKTDELDAAFDQATLGLEKAKRDLQRAENLYRDSVATLEQLQNATTAYAIAEKQWEAIGFNKHYAFIYAKEDGFVTKKLANESEIIAGGMPVLAIHPNNSEDWVLRVGLADKDWALVETGNAAQVVLDAFPDKIFTGKVTRKSLAAERGSGSLQVEIKVDIGRLTPAIGMFGTAHIRTNVVQQYRAIPYEAVIEADGKNAFVFVPLPDGKVKRQAIEIAGFDNDFVQVKSGLEDVPSVVLTNTAFLNATSTITIIQ